jgi:hypothetical protein
MGTFAETAIVDYCLSSADQGKALLFSISVCSKQTKVCRFCLPFAANKQRYPFSVISVFVNINTVNMLSFHTKNGKQTPKLFSLICLSFAHRENGSLLFVRLLTKITNISSPFANGLNGLNGVTP